MNDSSRTHLQPIPNLPRPRPPTSLHWLFQVECQQAVLLSKSVKLHEMISHESKIQLCKILLFDECEPLNLISLSSWEQSCLTPVCMRATARSHTHTHTHWQEVSQEKVSGRQSNKKCVSQLNGSVRLLSEWVCFYMVLPIHEVIIYQLLRHKSRRVRPPFPHSYPFTVMSASSCLFIWHRLWNL